MALQMEVTAKKQRMLTVANRLPITIKKIDGKYTYSQSSGGLVTGLSGLSDQYEKLWFGWAGLEVPQEDVATVEKDIKEQYGGRPLWIDDALMESHYNGYSNGILWPLLHYHSGNMIFYEQPWQSYIKVNQIFAREIAASARSGDIVWIHDYHLMLMPEMLRAEIAGRGLKDVQIGFFLHVPFPSSSEFMKLPYRDTVLRGVLHADLIGFHTHEYATHFLSTVKKVLHFRTSPNGVQFGEKTVHVGAFPIGINPDKELGLLKSSAVQKLMKDWKEGVYKDKKVIISVDRLDYIKGLPHKFHAYELFLEANPELVGKVVLIQIAVPSRQDVPEYRELRSQVSELAGRINSTYGDVEYTPLVFKYGSVDSENLVALFGMADVCLVCSTRDGMNLVAYEYIASQRDRKGVLILSEFAGASNAMRGALSINPWDTGDVMEQLRIALNMPMERRIKRWEQLNAYVNKYTSSYWGQIFTEELARIGGHVTQEVKLRQNSESSSVSIDNSQISLNRMVEDIQSDRSSRSVHSTRSHDSEGSVTPDLSKLAIKESEEPPTTNGFYI